VVGFRRAVVPFHYLPSDLQAVPLAVGRAFRNFGAVVIVEYLVKFIGEDWDAVVFDEYVIPLRIEMRRYIDLSSPVAVLYGVDENVG
jgi:hypothetical protein